MISCRRFCIFISRTAAANLNAQHYSWANV